MNWLKILLYASAAGFFVCTVVLLVMAGWYRLRTGRSIWADLLEDFRGPHK